MFGLWAVVLTVALVAGKGWDVAKTYLNYTVNYTEPLFVVVIMALAATRPVVSFAEGALRRIAGLGGGTPFAWWLSILTIGPVLGSFITEPAAMTICALLLVRQFYDLDPSARFKYATLGLLFVNVSIGGTLTHFAAPPVLMVARPWNWDTPFMVGEFGWRAVVAILIANGVYAAIFWRELRELAARPPRRDLEVPEQGVDGTFAPLLPVPAWVTLVHVVFIAWTVFTAHYPGLFIAGFLFFLGFAKATAPYQSRVDLRSPLLVGSFLGGLVIHGGLQGWWILVPDDRILIHVARPRCEFIGRAELGTGFREWTASDSAVCPDGRPGGVLLADVEEWPHAVPLDVAVQRTDPTASNPYVQGNAAGFRSGIVLITANEYATVMALSREVQKI